MWLLRYFHATFRMIWTIRSTQNVTSLPKTTYNGLFSVVFLCVYLSQRCSTAYLSPYFAHIMRVYARSNNYLLLHIQNTVQTPYNRFSNDHIGNSTDMVAWEFRGTFRGTKMSKIMRCRMGLTTILYPYVHEIYRITTP